MPGRASRDRRQGYRGGYGAALKRKREGVDAAVQLLVTGGGGFIGSHLVERLVRDGHRVRVIDNFTTGHRRNLSTVIDDIDLVEGDLQSYERAHAAVRGCEIVFHEAAMPSVPRSVQDPLTSNAANVIGTLNVLLAARDSGVRRVVFASSSSVYGSNPTLPKHEDLAALPISPYAVGKLAGEGYCRSFTEVYGLETVALRYFNVFGARQDPLSQYAAVIPNFITGALRGEAPTIFGDGEQSRDFTYVENVVEGNLLAMSAEGIAGRAYNIACGDRITLNGLVRTIARVLGRSIEPRYEAPRPGDVRHSMADTSRARQDFGYEPVVGFEDGLARTVRYYTEASDAPAAAAVS
jgi:nucleoside-diphosphate-sugar epimerase